MKQAKTKRIITMLLAVALLTFTGCAKSEEARQLNAYLEENHSAPEEKAGLAPEELSGVLEEEGFSVEQYEEVGGLGITADRVKPVKDEEYLDICYGVMDEQDVQDIMEYYIEQYDKCSIMTGKDTVFCYSSEAVAKQAGLFAE